VAIYTEAEQQERFARLNRAASFAPSEPLSQGPVPPLLREEVAGMLAAGRPQEALETLDCAAGTDDEALLNLRGVCLMRLGRAAAAVSLFRTLALSNVTARLRSGVPPAYVVNFATALVLAGNAAGARRLLDELGRDDLAAVARLRAALDRRRRAFSPVQKMLAALGVEPEEPVELPFPPGETE
jgi:hypothetical protein